MVTILETILQYYALEDVGSIPFIQCTISVKQHVYFIWKINKCLDENY